MTRRRSRSLVAALPQARSVNRVTGSPTSPEDHAIRQAAAWLDAGLAGKPIPPLVIAVGFGGGHLLDVLDERAPETRVLALEPDPVAVRAFLSRTDRRQWREHGRLLYLAGPDYAGADGAWRLFPATDAYVLLLHPAMAQDASSVAGALRTVKRIVFGVKANADARRRLAPRYLANVLHNVPAIAAGHDVRALTDVYRGVPAIVAAAGPSLDAAIDDLRAVQGRALLIAVDTALRPLLHAGITPHLVVGADPSDLNARHFQALPACPDTWLVAESALDRSATRIFDDRTFWFRLARHHPWPWLNDIGIDIGHVEMWGSVLTAAFHVACLAGCDPIVLVGADLAFTNGRPYCRGTTYEYDWAAATACGQTLETVWAEQLARKAVTRVADVRGGDTMTTSSMLSFRDWMVAAASRSDRRVINATGAGILSGSGIAQAPLRQALAEARSPLLLEAIARAPRLSAPPDLTAHLVNIREALHASRTASAPVAAWSAFVGDGFDPSAFCRIVEDAARELCGTEASPPAPPLTGDWSSLTVSPTASRLPFLLPESLTRLRTALVERMALPDRHDVDPHDDVELLALALGLLRQVCVVTRDTNALPSLTGAATSAAPVSARYRWSDSTNWLIAAFEGLLGHVCRAPIPSPTASFFTNPLSVRDDAPASAFSTEGPSRRHTDAACLSLLLEWLQVTAGLEPLSLALGQQFIRQLRLLDIPSRSGAPSDADAHGVAIVIRLDDGSDAYTLRLPLQLTRAVTARVTTGAIVCDSISGSVDIAHIRNGPLSISAQVHSAPVQSRARSESMANVARIRPCILTDEGVPRAGVMYSTAHGVVCLSAHSRESFIIREDGSVRQHHSWPHTAVAELAFGAHGAIAWSNGLASPLSPGPAYVMYRHSREEAPTVAELPVRPSFGTWWRGRLYWCCLPTPANDWTGLCSWTPDDGVRREASGLALVGMHEDDGVLVLEPRALRDGRPVRRRLTQRWKWWPNGTLEPFPVAAHGGAAGRTTSDDWTATAYPDTDLILLESSSQSAISLRCHYPLRITWLGGSLLVSTGERELLLFRDLRRLLHAKALLQALSLTDETSSRTPNDIAMHPTPYVEPTTERREP